MNKSDDKDDINFFLEQMQGIKKLKTDGKVLVRKQPPKLQKRPIFPEEFPTEFPFSDHIDQYVTAETHLLFSRPGIQHKVLRSLRHGEIRWQATLDLHGTTVVQARSILSHFLRENIHRGHRCLLIIHGKGKLDHEPPILKNQINNWLQQYPDVLAFSSATPKDGGAGAVYVLLRNVANDKFSKPK